MGHEVTMSKITQDQLKKKKKDLSKNKRKKKKHGTSIFSNTSNGCLVQTELT